MKNNASNLETLKNDNRALLLRQIRRAPISRVELSKLTHLSKSAITTIINEMMERGEIIATDTVALPKGRRPVLLDINARHRYAVGLSLLRDEFSVVITDLRANEVASCSISAGAFSARKDALGWICQSIDGLLQKTGIEKDKLIGIGVSSPGPLDYKRGVILTPPNFEIFWDTDIKGFLSGRFGLPVCLENNSLLSGMRVFNNTSSRLGRNIMFVLVSAGGIGSCIMCDGQLFRGSAGYCGELGHTSVDNDGPVCRCGNRGCLEGCLRMDALKKRFLFTNFADVCARARRGGSDEGVIMDYIAGKFCDALINAVNLLDLDTVCISGDLEPARDLLAPRMEALLAQRCVIARAHPIRVYFEPTSPQSLVLSSVEGILDMYFNQQL